MLKVYILNFKLYTLIMKKHLVSIMLIFSLLIACTNEKKEVTQKPNETNEIVPTPKLYVQTVTIVGVDENEKTSKKSTVIDSDYFEIGLFSLVDKSKGFHAKIDIEKPESIDNFRMVFAQIVDERDSAIYFRGSTEFLNFISERGYKMIDQVKKKYSTDYTFQKK